MIRSTFMCGLLSSTVVAVSDAEPTPSGPYEFNAAGHRILISKVIPAGRAADGTYVSAVTVKYDFKGGSTVRLNVFGTLPAKGQYTFTTRASALVFTDATDTKVAVPLRQTESIAGPTGQTIPSLDSFPSSYRTFSYKNAATFVEHLYPEVQTYFYTCSGDTVANDNRFYVTTYAVISTGDPHIFCKIALSIRAPEPPPHSTFQYGISYVAQEKNLAGEWHDVSSAASTKALSDFVTTFATGLSH